MRLRRAYPHTLAGAYALDALGKADRAAFERHMQACEDCRHEAASLREAAARLGSATAVTPPERLREQVLAQAARTRQLPPHVAEDRHRVPAWRRLGRALPASPRFAVALAGACMLIALALGTLVLSTQHRLSLEQARSGEIAAVLNAPDAHMMTVRGSTGGSATVVMSHARSALVLTTVSLPVLPSSEGYEVWLMGRGGDRSAGMLPAAHRGMTPPMIVSGLAAGDRIGLTVEPSGGSSRPTSPPVVMLALPS